MTKNGLDTKKIGKTPESIQGDFIQGRSSSEIADKLGVFLSGFEEHFGKESSKYGQLHFDDEFKLGKDSSGDTYLVRRRNKKEIRVKLDSTEIFQDTYKPTPLLPELTLQRKPNGRYAFGEYEVITTNMDTLRDEIQRIAYVLTQMCMTRGKLKELSDICRIVDTGTEGKRGLPIYELVHNPYKDSTFGGIIPSYFWKSESLHFDRIQWILRNEQGKRPSGKESYPAIQEIFEEALRRELSRHEKKN